MSRRNFLKLIGVAPLAGLIATQAKTAEQEVMPVEAVRGKPTYVDIKVIRDYIKSPGLHIIAGLCGTGKSKALGELFYKSMIWPSTNLLRFDSKTILCKLESEFIKYDELYIDETIFEHPGEEKFFFTMLNVWATFRNKKVFVSYQLKQKGRGMPFEESEIFEQAKSIIELTGVSIVPHSDKPLDYTPYFQFKFLKKEEA